MLSSWVLRPGISFGPFLLGDTVYNVLHLLSQFDFPYRQVYDFEHPFEQELVIDMIVLRFIFDAGTQQLKVIHVYPFPQLIRIQDTTFDSADRSYPPAALQHPALSLKKDESPTDQLKPNVGNILGLLGSSQTHLTDDHTCIFAYPQDGVTLVCPFIGSDKQHANSHITSVDISPLIEPHFLIHAPVTNTTGEQQQEVTWFPKLDANSSRNPKISQFHPIQNIPLPMIHSHEQYQKPQYMIVGQGISFQPPMVTEIEKTRMQISLPFSSVLLHAQSNSVYPVLGYPSRIVHHQQGNACLKEQQEESMLDIWIYEQLGICLCIDTVLHSIESIMCYTNQPGHPLFGMLQKCNFVVLPSVIDVLDVIKENVLQLEKGQISLIPNHARDHPLVMNNITSFIKEQQTNSTSNIDSQKSIGINCILPTDNVLQVSCFSASYGQTAAEQDPESVLPIPMAFETPWEDFGISLVEDEKKDTVQVQQDRIHEDIMEIIELAEWCVEYGESNLQQRNMHTKPQKEHLKEIVVESQSKKQQSNYCVPWTYLWNKLAVDCDANGNLAKVGLL